ncbi:hypothetical protein AB0G85_02080 [Streptomyces sioyaensis]
MRDPRRLPCGYQDGIDRSSTTLTIALHETLDLSRLLRACRTPRAKRT